LRNTAVLNFCTHIIIISAPTLFLPQCGSQPAEPEAASFLKLSGEVRNRIYDFALHEDEPIYITGPEDYIDGRNVILELPIRPVSSAKALPLHVLL
jgi:hypothetical protein